MAPIRPTGILNQSFRPRAMGAEGPKARGAPARGSQLGAGSHAPTGGPR